MHVLRKWRWSILSTVFVTAACGTGEGRGDPSTKARENEHHAQPGVVLTVESEDAGVCGRNRDFRFGIVNGTSQPLTDGALIFPVSSADPDRGDLLCGATEEGRCVFRPITLGVHPSPFPAECMLKLSPGDDFACRGALPNTHVGAILIASSGGVPVRVEAAANCDRTPPIGPPGDLSGALTVTAEEAGACGVDRTFRFGLDNTTGRRLGNVLVRFNRSSTRDEVPMQQLLCGARDGTCMFKTLAADVPLNAIRGIFPECALTLSAGDDFGCRGALPETVLRASVTAVADGAEMLGFAEASCQVPPPGPPEDVADALAVTAEDDGVCGKDRTFRFGLQNTTESRMGDIVVRFLRNPVGDVPARASLLCGATDEGACVLRTFDADSHFDRILQLFPDCLMRLSAGDDFACRATLPETRVDAFLTATVNGQPVKAESVASCQAASPAQDP